MTIECYYSDCPFHSCHTPGEEGPFCYEDNCQASEAETHSYGVIRQLRNDLAALQKKHEEEVKRKDDIIESLNQVSKTDAEIINNWAKRYDELQAKLDYVNLQSCPQCDQAEQRVGALLTERDLMLKTHQDNIKRLQDCIQVDSDKINSLIDNLKETEQERNRATYLLEVIEELASERLTALKQVDQRVRELEQDLLLARKALWLQHGHSGLYGDDGEMQCASCMPMADYKRMALSDLIIHVLKQKEQERDRLREELTVTADRLQTRNNVCVAQKIELDIAYGVWSNLAGLVGCTSTDGSAELGQVELYQEENATLKAQVERVRKRLKSLRCSILPDEMSKRWIKDQIRSIEEALTPAEVKHEG